MPAPSQKKIAAFWTWFQANEDRLFALKQDDDEQMDAILDEITEQLGKIDPNVVCEISSIKKGKRELIISADGIRETFPAVDALVAAAPALPRWTLFKFRQRHNPIDDMQVEHTLIAASEVDCAIEPDGDKIAVLMFIPKVKDEMRGKEFGYYFLDEALGEYDVETKVSAIEILPFDKLRDYPRFPLPELAQRFDALYSQLRGTK